MANINLEPIKTTLKQPRVKWGLLALILLVPLLWLGFTQPWQHQPRLPTGPLPAPQAPAASTLPPDIQALKDEGMRLWGINTADAMNAAVPLLEQVGEYGDGEALYFLGELERRNSMGHFSKAAINRYLQAAEAGDVYAMIRLYQAGACRLGNYCPQDAADWDIKARQTARIAVEQGDADAMVAYYFSGGGLQWLNLAAHQNNARALSHLGLMISDGRYPGWPYYRYWSEDARYKAALPWYRRAAELGYAPAMTHLAMSLHYLGDYEESWKWSLKAAGMGVVERNLYIAGCFFNPNLTKESNCPVPQNTAKGLGILLMLQREVGEHYTAVKFRLESDVINAMTDEERAAAEAFSIEWQRNLKAPLSRYPSRFGL